MDSEAHLTILRQRFGSRAEAVYEHPKTGYEVDRGIGLLAAVKLPARLAVAALKMPISTWLRAASTLKSCAPLVTR